MTILLQPVSAFYALLHRARWTAHRSLPAPTRCACREGHLCGEGGRLLLALAHATAQRDWPRWHDLHAELAPHRRALRGEA